MLDIFRHAFLLACALASSDVAWTSMGQFKISHPAFLSVTKFNDSDEFLLVSSFVPFWWGGVYVVPNIKEAIKSDSVESMQPFKLNQGSFLWPNQVEVIPGDVFGNGTRAIVVPDGFLVPGHSHGGIYILTVSNTDITKATACYTMTSNSEGYFYHMGEWIDMNGDGRKDFVTAKSNAKAGGGRLVWYEHPEGGLQETPWIEYIIVNGPDIGITIDQTTYKDDILVYATQFFDQSVNMYRIRKIGGVVLQHRVIDNTTILHAYVPSIVNLNNEANETQLMVNNHEKDENTNGVYAYTMPKNIWEDEWPKTTLASGFKNAFNIFVPGMSPGFPYAMYPTVSDKGRKPPHIVIAGDGDYTAHILTRNGSLSYEMDTIKNEGGTVGALAWSDLDGDDWSELWVPNYDKSYIELFKFSDATKGRKY